MAVVNLLHNHQIVFIHIPKTGGPSIRRGFFNNNFEKYVGPNFPKDWETLFKFGFVRNPFDRFISAYKMFTNGFTNDNPHIELGLKYDFKPKDFLQMVKEDKNYFDTFGIGFHTYPQTHKFNFLDKADYVGRFESLEQDFKKICEINRIKYEQLPHWNKTNRVDYREYYDDELIKEVSDYYSEDLKKLNYTF